MRRGRYRMGTPNDPVTEAIGELSEICEQIGLVAVR